MANNKMIAVLDILGFSDLTCNTNLHVLNDVIMEYFRCALAFALLGNKTPTKSYNMPELRKLTNIGFAHFSDTILLYSNDDTEEGYLRLVNTVHRMLVYTMSPVVKSIGPSSATARKEYIEVRLRGGIAYGEFYSDVENDIYLGKAIIDAHKLEKRQEWSGCAFTEKAKGKIPQQYWLTGRGYTGWPVREYDVPVKPSQGIYAYRSGEHKNTLQYETEKMLVVDWTASFQHRPSDLKLDGSHQKIQNTKLFHDSVCTEPACVRPSN